MITFEVKNNNTINWYIEAYLSHRRGKFSHIFYYNSGRKWHKSFRVNGLAHRLNGPAATAWHTNGQMCVRSYYIDGMLISSKLWNDDGKMTHNYPPLKKLKSKGLLSKMIRFFTRTNKADLND